MYFFFNNFHSAGSIEFNQLYRHSPLHLIFCKLAGILQIHDLFTGGWVMSSQSQTAQSVPARPPLPDLTQQLVTKSRRERHLPFSYT